VYSIQDDALAQLLIEHSILCLQQTRSSSSTKSLAHRNSPPAIRMRYRRRCSAGFAIPPMAQDLIQAPGLCRSLSTKSLACGSRMDDNAASCFFFFFYLRCEGFRPFCQGRCCTQQMSLVAFFLNGQLTACLHPSPLPTLCVHVCIRSLSGYVFFAPFNFFPALLHHAICMRINLQLDTVWYRKHSFK